MTDLEVEIMDFVNENLLHHYPHVFFHWPFILCSEMKEQNTRIFHMYGSSLRYKYFNMLPDKFINYLINYLNAVYDINHEIELL